MAFGYFPEPLLLQIDPDLARFLENEFARVSKETTIIDFIRLQETFVAPDKPRNFEIRFADGTNWNPGGGRGLYIYYDALWRRIV